MHLLDHLLGFENFMVTLVKNPGRIDALLEGVFAFLRGLVEQYAAYPYVDAVMLYDDQAMQTGPFFSMATWRRIFKPRYMDLCALVHREGLKIIFHSCGNLQAHLPELCDCGVDAIDNKQPSLWMHSLTTGRLVGAVCFCTCIDMVQLLTMRPRQVSNAVGDLIRTLSTPSGGFLGTTYNFTNPSLEAEILDAMWDAYRDFRW
jgi:uroporphyrinogen decarboxylase